MTTTEMINYTNAKLANWYRNAKIDYNIEGSAICRIEGDEFIVDYIENGVKATWKMFFHVDYLSNGKDYFFNVWSEEATTPQPVDVYEGLELSEDVPTSENINEALGVKNPCSFMQAVEANTAENASCLPVKERQLTEEQKHFYWDAYHEGYKQGQAELNDIVNP